MSASPFSSMNSRDQRALLLLVLVLAPTLIWYFFLSEEGVAPAASAASALPVPVMEKRLQTLRQQAALNPAKQEVREILSVAVADREKLLLRADTPQQVQAELLAKVRTVLQSQNPPLQASQSDLGPITRVDDNYGEVSVTVGFRCPVEQLVNVLADLAAIEEMVATKQISVLAADRAKKILSVRLTVSALMPGSLAPQQTGGLFQ